MKKFCDPNDYNALAAGFDQEASCVTMARIGILRAESEEPIEVLKWLDRTLIRVVSRFAKYNRDDASSFQLNKEFSLYP